MTRLARECRRISSDLAAYLYDDLDSDRRAALNRHLSHCHACRVRARALRQTCVMLDRWKIASPTAADHQAIVQAMSAAREQPSRWERLAVWAEDCFAQPLRRAVALAILTVVLSLGVVRLADARDAPALPTAQEDILLVDLGPDEWIATAPGPVPMEFAPPCVPAPP